MQSLRDAYRDFVDCIIGNDFAEILFECAYGEHKCDDCDMHTGTFLTAK